MLQTRSAFVANAHLTFARAGLAHKLQNVDGLSQLLREELFRPFLGDGVAELLADFPDTQSDILGDLLQYALSERSTFTKLPQLAEKALVNTQRPQADMWLAAGYLSSPEQFLCQVKCRFAEDSSVTWVFRNMIGLEQSNKPLGDVFSPSRLEHFVSYVGSRFPDTGQHARSGWADEGTPEQAADFVRGMISRISSSSGTDATEALERLAEECSLISYHGYIQTCPRQSAD